MPNRSTAALRTPRAVTLITQETVLSLWNRLTMGAVVAGFIPRMLPCFESSQF